MGIGKTEASMIKIHTEHISFELNGVYMDVENHIDYVDISIGGTENEKFPVTMDDWNIIDRKVREILKQNER